jgi:hypothetical protein
LASNPSASFFFLFFAIFEEYEFNGGESSAGDRRQG